MSTDSQLGAAGEVALTAARIEWKRRIVDPPVRTWRDPAWDKSRLAIDGYIRGDLGLGWSRCSTLVKAYRHDNDFEWCGAFAAFAWRCAGLDPGLAHLYFASTYRLARYAERRLAFGSPRELALRSRFDGKGRRTLVFDGATTYEDVAAFGPRAGDILIVNGTGFGQHVTLVSRWDPDAGVFETIEGNATGTGPDETTFQGVVSQRRKFSACRRLVRPDLHDLTSPPRHHVG